MNLSRSKGTNMSNIASCSIVIFIIIHIQSPIIWNGLYFLYLVFIFNMVLFTYFMQSIDIHLIFIKMENSLTRKSSLFFHRELLYMLFLKIGIMLIKK